MGEGLIVGFLLLGLDVFLKEEEDEGEEVVTPAAGSRRRGRSPRRLRRPRRHRLPALCRPRCHRRPRLPHLQGEEG